MPPKRRLKTRLGELLLEKGVITRERLDEALALQRTKCKGKVLGEVLSDLGYVTEEEIYSALAMQLGYPYIKIANCSIDEEALTLVPQESAEKFNIMPVDRIGNILTVAMLNPLDEDSLKGLEETLGLKIKIFVTTPSELKKAQRENYGAGGI